MSAPDLPDYTQPTANPVYRLKTVVIAILESVFEQEYLYQDVKNSFRILWDDDGEISDDSDLIISDVFSEDLTKTDPRPLIIIKRGPFKSSYVLTTLNAVDISFLLDPTVFISESIVFLCCFKRLALNVVKPSR